MGPAQPIAILEKLSSAQLVFSRARPCLAGWRWAQPGPATVYLTCNASDYHPADL